MSATASALDGGSTAYATPRPVDEGWTNERLGIWLFIISEAIIFASFLAQYFYARVLSTGWPPRGFEEVPVHIVLGLDPLRINPVPLILTAFLAASGFTAHNAQTAIRRDDREGLQGWLIVTIGLGVLFLAGQAYEYINLIFHESFGINSGIYGSAFFSLTGLHGLHVTAGVILLAGVLLRAFMGHFSSWNHFGVEGTVLYWHFVDAVWAALLLSLYIF